MADPRISVIRSGIWRGTIGAQHSRKGLEVQIAGRDLCARQDSPLKVVEEEVPFAALASREHPGAVGAIHTEADRAKELEQHGLRLLGGLGIGQAVGQDVRREAREFVLDEWIHRRGSRLRAVRADGTWLKVGVAHRRLACAPP